MSEQEREKFEEFWPKLTTCFTPDVHIEVKLGSYQAWLERARLANKEIERLKVEIQKYKMFIKNYPSIIGNIIKEAVEELEKEAK